MKINILEQYILKELTEPDDIRRLDRHLHHAITQWDQLSQESQDTVLEYYISRIFTDADDIIFRVQYLQQQPSYSKIYPLLQAKVNNMPVVRDQDYLSYVIACLVLDIPVQWQKRTIPLNTDLPLNPVTWYIHEAIIHKAPVGDVKNWLYLQQLSYCKQLSIEKNVAILLNLDINTLKKRDRKKYISAANRLMVNHYFSVSTQHLYDIHVKISDYLANKKIDEQNSYYGVPPALYTMVENGPVAYRHFAVQHLMSGEIFPFGDTLYTHAVDLKDVPVPHALIEDNILFNDFIQNIQQHHEHHDGAIFGILHNDKLPLTDAIFKHSSNGFKWLMALAITQVMINTPHFNMGLADSVDFIAQYLPIDASQMHNLLSSEYTLEQKIDIANSLFHEDLITILHDVDLGNTHKTWCKNGVIIDLEKKLFVLDMEERDTLNRVFPFVKIFHNLNLAFIDNTYNMC